jgi:dUTPase
MSLTKIHVIPNGMLPIREKNAQKDGDVGINLSVRAVITTESVEEQRARNLENIPRRKTLFDFMNPADPEIKSFNILLPDEDHGFRYLLHPNESVSLGLGVVVEIPHGYAWYVKPRSSTIQKYGRNCVLTVLNSDVPGDPGFRGEIWAELYNYGPRPFPIHRHMVLFQLVRHKIDDSDPIIVEHFLDLSKTDRGGMSNGHTDETFRKGVGI